MSKKFKINISGWSHGAAIPSKYAFGKINAETHIELSENLSPAIAWENAPKGTKSFAIICHDPDVPSSGEDVNQEGKTVPANLPRVDFYHWALVNVPTSMTAIAEGAASSGVLPKGKAVGVKPYGLAGINSYTDWFAGDPEMVGDYGDYDGPCPPWNDSIMHHYHFTIYALDAETLVLSGAFSGADIIDAIEGKVLAQDTHIGTYSLNPDLQ
ncbi:MAG: YbhB/YbcL family Raf kinase inhibitor-like protein [Hyphomicrobiales bacterium]